MPRDILNKINIFRLVMLSLGFWALFLQSAAAQLPQPPAASDGTTPPSLFPPLKENADRRSDFSRKDRKIVLIRDNDSWYFDNFTQKTIAQLNALAEGSYELKIEEVNAKGSLTALNAAFKKALADDSVDLVIASGYIATQHAMKLSDAERKRPVLGGAVEFSDTLERAISTEGTSKVKNYSFITNPQRLSADMAALRDLSGEKRIYAVVDSRLMTQMRDPKKVAEVTRRLEAKHGVKVQLLPVGNSVNEIMAAIPSAAKAVYVSILPQVPPERRKELFEAMAKRSLITLSMVGLPDVRLGALSGLAPDNADAIAKRAALNAHQILLGIGTDSLPVYLPVEDRLIINRETAELAQWYPDYETVLTAEFLDEGNREKGDSITLEQAMKLAAKGNADVLIQLEEEIIAQQDLEQAKSFKLPTVNLGLGQNFTDYTDRINQQMTPDRLNAGSYGLELRQSLFNDSIRSNIRAARETVAAERLNSRSQELDAMEAAGTAYLNYLSARSLWQIQKENLRLTENNLQLARLRVEIGAVEESETYRWEQDAASSRASVFQAEADRDNALIELNRILGQPREKTWQIADIALADEESYFMDNVLSHRLENEGDVITFAQFLREVAVPASPELAAFDFGLVAQGIRLAQIERSFFLPELAAVFGFDRVGQGTEALDYTTQGEATAGISLSFPLYEGGLRKAEAAGQRAIVRQLAAQRERTVQLIEQRALTSLNGLTSEHPNIRLSRRALVAAEKNYESVRQKYSEGAASILDLLDGQSALLRQRQNASLAVYSYLQEIVGMQRAIAWFEHEKSATEKEQWKKMFGTFMSEKRLEVPAVVIPDADATKALEKAEAAVSLATAEDSKQDLKRQEGVVEASKESQSPKPNLLRRIFKRKSE